MNSSLNLDQSSIKELRLSRRTFHVLRRNGIYTVGKLKELFQNEGLKKTYFIGAKGIEEVSVALKEFYAQQHLPLDTSPSYSEISTTEINHVPITILNLPFSVRGRLMKHGITTVGDLLSVTDEMLLNINQIGPKALSEIRRSVEAVVDGSNRPLPKTAWADIAVASQFERPASNFDAQHTSATIKKDTHLRSWTELIQGYFESTKENYAYILLARFGYRPKKLEQIAVELNITRERVRQIQTIAVSRFLRHLRIEGSARLLNRIHKILLDYGDKLSLESFKQQLQKENLLGNFGPGSVPERIAKIDSFDALICWLTLLSDPRYSEPPINFPIDLRSLVKSGSVPVKDFARIRNVSPKLKKEVWRKVLFTGGVNLREASKILSEDESITKLVLQQLDLKRIKDDWYVLKQYDREQNRSRMPLQIAGQKMLAVTSYIPLDSFCDGLRRHVNRFYPAIAPVHVVICMLQLLGFEIDDQQMVSSKLNSVDILSASERSLVSAVKKNDGVASFLEIAEEFFLHKLSLPAVSVTLKRSPIAEKVDDGYYKLRGTEVFWQQIEAAKKRQKRYSQDEEVAHGLDGIVRVKLTVNSYAYLTGVVGSHRIRGLAGSWTILCNNEALGDAKMDETYLWGLPKVFKHLDVQTGDRIELAFNTWNRTLSVEKVNNGNTR